MTQTANDEGGRRGPARELESDEIGAVVTRNYWAVLSTAGADQPYAVPIIYGYDGAFYAVLRDGRKIRNMEANPHVCLNVVEVQDMARTWRSVLAVGRAAFVETDEEMRVAIDVIRAQYPGLPTRSGATMEGLRSQGFRVLRMDVMEMTGRGQG